MSKALYFIRLTDRASAPFRATEGAAGYDLFASEASIIPARGHGMVRTGIAVQLPPECYGRIAPRSSLAARGIDVGAGVVDVDYRGELKVILYNFSDDVFFVAVGDRIAQLILERNYIVPIMERSVLSDTARGDGGFGSTDSNGVNLRVPST